MCIQPRFQKPSPAQIEVWIQKQTYQFCIERSEYLSPIRCARGPVLVNHIDEIGMMSGLVDTMVADRIADGTHDAWVTRDCRRKMEMSPSVQSRDDTRVPDGHEQRDSDCISAGELSSAFDCRAGSGLNYYVGDR